MKSVLCIVSVFALIGVGCEEKAKPVGAGPTGATAPAAVLPASLFLASEPEGAKPVNEAKEGAKAGDDVVIRGRIGGSLHPFVDGRAVFTIISPSMKSCADNPDDACKTPWDYCCESKADIATHTATIQVVDAAGAPLKAAVKGQNGVKELSHLVIVGKIAQAEGKVMVVNATGVFVATP